MKNIDERFRAKANTEGRYPALAVRNGSAMSVLTWRELERATGELAEQLAQESGRAHPGAIVLETDNRYASTLLLLAALRIDAPVLVLNGKAARKENSAMCDQLLRAGHTFVAARCDDRSKLVSHHFVPERPAARMSLPRHAILYGTGGSSGFPKVVVDATTRLVAGRLGACRLTSKLNWRTGQRQLIVGPLHHAATLSFFIEALCDANTLVIQPTFTAELAFELIEEFAIEWLQLTPFHMQRMATASKRKLPDLGSVRAVLHTAAPCPDLVKHSWIDRLGPDRMFEMYGASESVGVTLARGDEWLARPRTVGRGFLTQVRIFDEGMAPVAAGTEGEVFLRTHRRRARDVYLGATRRIKSTSDGYMSVGDHGFVDHDGYLFLTPRWLDLINVGGENVYPAEVESVLLEHPLVVDAAVLADANERLGARVLALVVAERPLDTLEAELLASCRSQLSRFKVPYKIKFVDSLPRTDAGKLRRAGLGASVVGSETEPPVVGSRAQSRWQER